MTTLEASIRPASSVIHKSMSTNILSRKYSESNEYEYFRKYSIDIVRTAIKKLNSRMGRTKFPGHFGCGIPHKLSDHYASSIYQCIIQ